MKLILLNLFFLLASCGQLPTKRTDKLSILQGVTNSKEVEFSVVAPKVSNLKFEIRSDEGEIIAPSEIELITRDFSPLGVHKVLFLRDPSKIYNLYVFENGKVIDQRLVGRGQIDPARLKMAVVSCMNDHYSQHFKIWEELVKRNPEYLMMIGDNVYADKSSTAQPVTVNPEILWERYLDVRLALPIYFQDKLIPVHALWDDHDYGFNGAGESFKYKEESRKVFEAFFAQELSEENWSKGFGTGGLLSLGDFNFYFLDARTYRSGDADGEHLGKEQYNWLTGRLTEDSSPSFIVKGDQFFGGYHRFDSYEGNHAKEFVSFTNDLKKINTPFIFLSGDRHMSEIMQFPRGLFGKPSFEITSSPIHATLYPGKADPNPWRVVAEDAHMNFTMIENVAQNNHWFLDVETVGENGEVFYRRELAVYIKDLQNNLNEARKKRSGKRRYRRRR